MVHSAAFQSLVTALEAERAKYPDAAFIPPEFLGNSHLWLKVAQLAGHNTSVAPVRLGSGTQGTAYSLSNDKVLKVSFDSAEACSMEIVRQNPSPYTVMVYSVCGVKTVDGPVYYCIVQEKLAPPDPAWVDFANCFKSLPITVDNVDNLVGKWKNEKIVEYGSQIEWLRNVASYLASVGIEYKDFRGKNLMTRGNKHCLIDIGYGKTPNVNISMYQSKPDTDRYERVKAFLAKKYPIGSTVYEQVLNEQVPVKIVDFLLIKGQWYIVAMDGSNRFIIPAKGARRWTSKPEATTAAASNNIPSGFLDGSKYKELVYHGSHSSGLKELQPDRGGEHGIYVSPRKRYAALYGTHLYQCLINTKNPFVVHDKSEISPKDLTKEDVAKLEKAGYDSIVSTSSDISHADEIVLFSSKQVHIFKEE